ncbi:hypothetical protein [Enterocloster citroniae]|uniref:hypothetical protein n=1 Tax=Enterocloster citroniae TaxID=358743 RepID=UPI0002D4F6A0|nr:hypothetical protein [Enterocloster citroniae]
MSISSSIQNPDDIVNHVIAHTCDIGILPYPVESEGILCTPILKADHKQSLVLNLPSDISRRPTQTRPQL